MISLIANTSGHDLYYDEIFAQAGLTWSRVPVGQLDYRSIIVVTKHAPLDDQDRNHVAGCVLSGATLIAIGGTCGLDDLLGARETGLVDEGYLVDLAADHAVTRGVHSPLHAFRTATLSLDESHTGLGSISTTPGADPHGSAIIARRAGKGAIVVIGVDLAFAIWYIQFGFPVKSDAPPAPDGSAPLDEGLLKAEDGHVLSWEYDRLQTAIAPVPYCAGFDDAYPQGDTPWFAVPIADELRMLLLNAIAWGVVSTEKTLTRIAEWPRQLAGVAIMSHDSDMNRDESAHVTLELLREADIHSTWCHMWGPTYPDTYDPATFPKIQDQGHEIALHYNALEMEGGSWGEDKFRWQAEFVRNESGVDRFTTNKNHYTRWEGQFEFFRWLEREGVEVDQSRGPSKKGNVGYPFGTSLPVRPLEVEESRWYDVLELPMQFQDLWLTAPFYMAESTIHQTNRHGGVGHFLFHQIHLLTKPDVVDAFRDLISYTAGIGLEWWRSADINAWTRARREIRLFEDGGHTFALSSSDVNEVTIETIGGDASRTDGWLWNQPCQRFTRLLRAGKPTRLH